VCELDSAALVDEHVEEVTRDRSRLETEHPRTKTAREALLRMYLAVRPDIRQKVRVVYVGGS
jgi:hypothetical protein